MRTATSRAVPSDTEGVTVYKGVPFAQPPVGELRWKAPQDLTETWDGVRVCDKWGNQAMQPENLNPVGEFWGDEFYFDEAYNPEISEDCLYLNCLCTGARGRRAAPGHGLDPWRRL